MRRRLNLLLKIAVTAVGLAFILAQIDPAEAIRRLLQADLRWVGVALLLIMISLVLRAYRWMLLLQGLGVNLAFEKLVRLYFTGHFFNSFLPTGVGGDVVRILEVTKYVPADVATGTVLLDRFTGLLMLFVIALVALPFRPPSLPPEQALLVLLVAVAGLSAGFLLLHGTLLQRIAPYLPGPLSPQGNLAFTRLLQAVRATGWPAVRRALLVSLVFNFVQIGWWWSAARALHIPVPLNYLILVVPLLATSLLVPAIGGFGAREAVATLLFDGAVVTAGAEPLAAGTGLALSTLVFILERLAGLPGAPLYLWGTVRRR